jgi:hypothetical protein
MVQFQVEFMSWYKSTFFYKPVSKSIKDMILPESTVKFFAWFFAANFKIFIDKYYNN